MPPRTKNQFEELRTRSRTKIVSAATELFATHGYHATSISQIAHKARVSKGLLYNYFKSKDHLLDEIVQSAMREAEEPLLAMHSLSDPLEKIKLIIEGTFAMLEDKRNRKRWQFLLSIMTQYEVKQKLQKYFTQYMKLYLPILKQMFTELEVPNPGIECYRITALLDGFGLHYLLYADAGNYPVKEIKTEIIKYYESFKKKK